MPDETIPITKPAAQKTSIVTQPDAEKKKFPTEIINLPSEGHFYSETPPLASGQLELKFMTARE